MNVSNLSGNFLIDMDEVSVNISYSQYKAIRANWRKYSRFFKDFGVLTEKEVLSRPVFKLSDWMIKDEYDELDEVEYKKVRDYIYSLITGDFFGTDFYSRLEPTDFAKRTLMNKSFIEHVRVNKIYIITRYVNDDMLESKMKFIKKWFNHPKIEVIAVPLHAKKTDYIKDITWNILIDDELKNIADFAENLDIEGKEFLIPKLGYNEMPPLLGLLIKEKGAVYNYFDEGIL